MGEVRTQFFLRGESHTLASCLRASLEELYPDDYVACTKVHPLDDHLEVDAPSEEAVRTSLLHVKDRIRQARVDVEEQCLRKKT